MSEPTLKRDIGYWLLTLYGLGTILGAGIYVLIGEVARSAGMAAPSAFLVASILAGVTAFSYAELSSRFPRSAGEAAYVDEGFRLVSAATLVGWAVIATGVVSAATMARGFVGYLDVFVSLPPALVIFVLVAGITTLAVWGISESLLLAAAVTLIEIAGLLLVAVIAGDSIAALPRDWLQLLPDAESASIMGVFSGAFIAFYAFIGFEDMVNIAEEVKKPETTLPRAIITALIVSTILYLAVATISVLAVPVASLAASGAPLAMIVEARGMSPTLISIISLFAVVNGGLVQLIMASRVLYGLASQGMTFRFFAAVHPVTRTPARATIVAGVVVLTLALSLNLNRLARVTSFIALGIFAAVNAALVLVKRGREPAAAFTVPLVLPVIGFLLCVAMLIYQIADILATVSE